MSHLHFRWPSASILQQCISGSAPEPLDPAIWRLDQVATCKGECTLILKERVEEHVLVMMWANQENGQTITVGPSCGIFLATSPKSKKCYAYDALIMYETLFNLLTRHSTLEVEYKTLCSFISECDTRFKRQSKLLTQAQCYEHFHLFRNSLVIIMYFSYFIQPKNARTGQSMNAEMACAITITCFVSGGFTNAWRRKAEGHVHIARLRMLPIVTRSLDMDPRKQVSM